MITSLPILDLSRLDSGDDEAAAFRADLLQATHDVGFFYLVGHGVDDRLTARLLALAREFFDLPDEDKRSIENTLSPQFRGYTRIGGERTAGAVDWREQIDIGVNRDVVEPGPGVPDYWRLEGPNLWPATLPELRVAVDEWNTQLNAVAIRLLRAWAVALGHRRTCSTAPSPIIRSR